MLKWGEKTEDRGGEFVWHSFRNRNWVCQNELREEMLKSASEHMVRAWI